MNKFDFTQGEWKEEKYGSKSAIETKNTSICDVFFTNRLEGVANARLISCAPEMLNIIINYLKEMQRVTVKNKKDEIGLKHFNDTFFDELKIIEKATGKKWSEINA